MFDVYINKPWNGMVAIRDWQVKHGITAGGLRLHVGHESMEIPGDFIEGAIVSRSKKEYEDKKTGTMQRLVYFIWKPTTIHTT